MMMPLNLKGPLNLTPEHRRSLFLGDLSCFCQEADIFRYFQQFGDIEEIRIKRNTNGAGLGYGFITFQTSEAAEAALNLDGVVILGRPIK
jgi:RNA recognition motif-containing protein